MKVKLKSIIKKSIKMDTENEASINILPMSVADILEVKALENGCHLSPWSMKDYAAELQRIDSISLVAKKERESIGFIIARLITSSNINHEIDVEIYNICVDKNYRNKRIGRLLFSTLINRVRHKAQAVWLEVRRSNTNAIIFYQKIGFKAVGTRKNLYSNPNDDAILMRKYL